jgi:hypothetical protein
LSLSALLPLHNCGGLTIDVGIEETKLDSQSAILLAVKIRCGVAYDELEVRLLSGDERHNGVAVELSMLIEAAV